MVIAVVVVDRARAIALRRLGAADSKQFGAGPEAIARRGELAELIRERALAHRIAVVDVERVDRYTFKGQLNVLEREVVHGLLVELGAAAGDRIVCDGANLFGPLKHQFPRLEAVDNGESVHVAVAAASILAKDRRDRAFSEIARRYEPEFGPLRGSGYCNAATRAFLSAYRSRYGCLPPETRKSWTGSTAGNVQRSLPFPRE
jgi:ribonuclease HII